MSTPEPEGALDVKCHQLDEPRQADQPVAAHGSGDQVRVAAAKSEWEQTVLGAALRAHPERRPEPRTGSGDAVVERLYTPLDIASSSYVRDLGFPGQYPFTRGIYPTMYRGRLFGTQQYAGYRTAEETNERFHYLMSQGNRRLSIAFDLPTQLGLDADDPRAIGEVGKVGVSVNSLRDFARIFDGIPLDQVTVNMTINAPAVVSLAFYLALAEQRGIPFPNLSATVQNEILKEYLARGTYVFPPQPSMRLCIDVLEYCVKHAPRINAISISGVHIREQGSTAAQEIGFTFANAVEYARAATERGLDVDDFGPIFSFQFVSHMDLFEEAAKFRAARRLWARIARERLGATRPEAMMLRFGTGGSGYSYTRQQPLNNIIRGTLMYLAAVLGGVQMASVPSYDEAFAIPTEEAVRIATRTSQIIAHESGVDKTVDPLGGSYYVESLTDAIEHRARDYIATIDGLGGAIAAMEQGYQQREIQHAAYQTAREIETGERVVVGVNAHTVDEDSEVPIFPFDESVAERQKERLVALRRERDNRPVLRALSEVRSAARSGQNLVPAVMEAVKADATLGEICAVFRDLWGEWEPPQTI